MTRYPSVTVVLCGEDGNAFSIMGRVSRALRRAGASDAEVAAYISEATAGDYNDLLQTTIKWVEVR
jgi:hypothetical protein